MSGRFRFRQFTPEMQDYIRRRVADGWTDDRIAGQLGCSGRSVGVYRVSIGLGRQAGATEVNRWTPLQLAQLQELADADYTAADIAQRIGKSKRAVIGIANRRGVKIRSAVAKAHQPLRDEAPVAPPIRDFAALIGPRRFEDDPRSLKPQPVMVVYRPATYVRQVGYLG